MKYISPKIIVKSIVLIILILMMMLVKDLIDAVKANSESIAILIEYQKDKVIKKGENNE